MPPSSSNELTSCSFQPFARPPVETHLLAHCLVTPANAANWLELPNTLDSPPFLWARTSLPLLDAMPFWTDYEMFLLCRLVCLRLLWSFMWSAVLMKTSSAAGLFQYRPFSLS